MSFFGILQIIIAIIFIYLILSLLASELQEAIAAFIQFRPRNLRQSITIFLNEANLHLNKSGKWSIKTFGEENDNEKKYKTYYQLTGEAQKAVQDKNWDIQHLDEIKFCFNQIQTTDKDRARGWIDKEGNPVLPSQVEVSEDDRNLGSIKDDSNNLDVMLVELEPKNKDIQSLTALIYEKSQIASLNQYTNLTLHSITAKLPSFTSFSGPSYIEKETFTEALLEVLQDNLDETDQLKANDSIDEIIRKIPKVKFYSPALSRLTQIAESVKLKQDGATLTQFREALHGLFEQAQERTSGVYKRNAKGTSFLVGLFIAVGVNVDIFYMFDALSKNPKLAADFATLSDIIVGENTKNFSKYQDCLKNNSNDESKCTKELQEFQSSVQNAFDSQQVVSVANLAEVITWEKLPQNANQKLTEQFTEFVTEYDNCLRPIFNESDSKERDKTIEKCSNDFKKQVTTISNQVKTPIITANKCLDTAQKKTKPQEWSNAVEKCVNEFQGEFTTDPKTSFTVRKALGWLISAFAIAMGAPFWFDLLGRCLNVRNAGKSIEPQKTPKSETSDNKA